MNLYLISQDKIEGYDTYDSAVVAAESESDARQVHPSSCVTHIKNGKYMGTHAGGPYAGEYEYRCDCEWVGVSETGCIKVKFLGETKLDRGVVLASFNAG